METSLLVRLGKELKKRYLVAADAGEAGVDAECGAKGLPEAPYGMRGGAALSRAAGTQRRLKTAPVSTEVMEGVRGSSCQDAVCGYTELKCERNWSSGRCQSRLASSAMLLRASGMKWWRAT